MLCLACQPSGVADPAVPTAKQQDDTDKSVLVAGGVAPAKAGPKPAQQEPTPMLLDPVPPPDMLTFRATLEIDKEPGGKRFQGVWLVREDGERWVVDYRARDHWKPFEGATVEAVGRTWSPQGQAISATHFRVHSLRVKPDAGTAWVYLGPEQKLSGRFEIRLGQAGSKLSGESWPVFIATGGGSYQLANEVTLKDKPGKRVEVTARPVERSPFTAHMPGPTLWILSID